MMMERMSGTGSGNEQQTKLNNVENKQGTRN